MQQMSAQLADEIVVVGKLGKPFGVQGWIYLHSFTSPASNIIDYPKLLLQSGNTWQDMAVTKIKPHKDTFVAKLSNCDCRNTVSMLTNLEVAIYRSWMPELDIDEYYWHDLIGCQVLNVASNQLIGTVADLIATPAQDVLLIHGKKNVLIPFKLGDIVEKVCLDTKIIQVNWSEE